MAIFAQAMRKTDKKFSFFKAFTPNSLTETIAAQQYLRSSAQTAMSQQQKLVNIISIGGEDLGDLKIRE
ncbi:hypothetical protein [uncultured Kiloniella sp.]|uniref:hypothetical protein n=1 Tax=uncultured Kiloniella sp. TaxID=1133091 RepID=UPI00261A2D55|nr:hypothetical protein [uncultured Kiloniella sp.]